MSDGPPPEDAFSLLANETRLRIIETLGDASDDDGYAALSYSTLESMLDGASPGNLNYHLRKLRDRFVEKADDRYQLTIPGIRVYQAISSGMFDERENVDPTPIDLPCDECGEPMYVSYEEGRFRMECRTCERVLLRYPLLPNTFDPDDSAELYRVASRRVNSDNRQLLSGICPYCSGPVDHEFDPGDSDIFEDGEYAVVVLATCRLCRWYAYMTSHTVSYCHPTFQVFFLERGVDATATAWIPGADIEETVLSRDPLRFEVRTTYEGDTLRQVFDDGLDLVEWDTAEDINSL